MIIFISATTKPGANGTELISLPVSKIHVSGLIFQDFGNLFKITDFSLHHLQRNIERFCWRKLLVL